jgi:LysM repeat protein
MDKNSETETVTVQLDEIGNPGHIGDEDHDDPEGIQKRKKSQRQFLFFAAVAVLILILASTLLFKAHDRAVKVEINTVHLKLTTLEMGVSRLEQEVNELRQSVSAQKESETRPNPKIDALSKRMDRLEKKIAAIAQVPQAPKPTPVKTTPQTKAKYHEVRRGETLFRISKDYGLSLEQLCRLNQITPDTPIHPGQKLLVSPK